jgi:hypothetical protein
MLERYGRNERSDETVRLAAVPRESLEAILLELGIGIEDFADVRDAVIAAKIVVTPQDVIRNSFERNSFRAGRFNRDTYGVYYAALEPETCTAEITYHLLKDAADSGFSPRYYRFIGARFVGSAVDLCGSSEELSFLISKDEAGYPLCQLLADEARNTGVDAFYTSSARREGGTCVPVFVQAGIRNPVLLSGMRFYWDGQSIVSHPY